MGRKEGSARAQDTSDDHPEPGPPTLLTENLLEELSLQSVCAGQLVWGCGLRERPDGPRTAGDSPSGDLGLVHPPPCEVTAFRAEPATLQGTFSHLS